MIAAVAGSGTGLVAHETVLLAMAAWDARTSRRLATAAVAAALQGVFYWLMLHEAVESTAVRSSKPLQVVIFELATHLEPGTLAQTPQAQPTRRAARKEQVQRAGQPAAAGPIVLPPGPAYVPHSQLYWLQQIQSEQRSDESRSRPGKLRFGFPQSPAAPPPAPQFGWDYAHTHRLQPLSGGGMLIHLNDHCALVIYGFVLFPGCRIGRIPANGHLFDHMHDHWNDGPGALP